MTARLVAFAGCSLLVGACGDTGEERSDDPPVGFGVDDEHHFATVLTYYAMSPSDAECVAREAFAAGAAANRHADGSYTIRQDMLAVAGDACGIDWSDYDFTTD